MANIGDILLQPESGWRRYDDRYSGLVYSGSTSYSSSAPSYNGTHTQFNYNGTIPKVNFTFYGKAIRLILNVTSICTTSAKISIDGIIHNFNASITGETIYSVLRFEKLFSTNETRKVEIYINDKYLVLDAIDIDKDGHICDINCNISHHKNFLIGDSNNVYSISDTDFTKYKISELSKSFINFNGMALDNTMILNTVNDSIILKDSTKVIDINEGIEVIDIPDLITENSIQIIDSSNSSILSVEGNSIVETTTGSFKDISLVNATYNNKIIKPKSVSGEEYTFDLTTDIKTVTEVI